MYPTITLAGHCGTAPEAQVLTTGRVKTTFRLAHTPRKLRDGEWIDDATIWFTIECWGKLAENVRDSVRLGDPLLVSGRLKVDRWDSGEGPRERKYVVADHIGLDMVFGRSVLHRKKRDDADEAAVRTRMELAAADPGDDVDEADEVCDPETGELLPV